MFCFIKYLMNSATIMKNTIDFRPNISIPSAIKLIKHPVTPPNSVIEPIAAPIWGSIPINVDNSIPNAAPDMKAGPMFPPLNPIAKHNDVNTAFKIKVYHIVLLFSAFSTSDVSLPQKSVFPIRYIHPIIINEPITILTYSFLILLNSFFEPSCILLKINANIRHIPIRSSIGIICFNPYSA